MEVQTRDRMLKLTLLSGVLLFCLTLLVYLTATTVRTIAIQQWTETTPYPLGVANRDVVVHGNHLYVVGGKIGDAQATTAVYYAEIMEDGSVGPWSSTEPYPYPVYIHSTTASDDHIYVVGGWNSGVGGQITNQVLRAPFNQDGSLGAWQLQTENYPDVIVLHDTVVIDNRLYVIGGWNGLHASSAVRYAPIGATGLGAWQDTTELPHALARHAVAYADGTLYVTGGSWDGGPQYADVYYAKVNADGKLGNWESATNLPNPLYYHGAVIHDGRLVVLGGRNNSQMFNNVRSSIIQANGSLGSWVAEPSLDEAIYRFGAASLEQWGSDYIYVANGLSIDGSSNDPSDIYHNQVYHSTVPPVYTPTPTPGIDTLLDNSPSRWLAPGEEVLYEIVLRGSTDYSFSDVKMTIQIPSQAELVTNSITAGNSTTYSNTGTAAGDTIRWEWSEFGIDEVDSVSYRVRRLLPSPPDTESAFTIVKSGPATVSANEEISYTLTVTNNTGIPHYNVTVEDALPIDATYVRGGQLEEGIVRWAVPAIGGSEALDFKFVVTAAQTLVNSNYRVLTSNGDRIRGFTPVVTVIEGTLPSPDGDGVVISNTGAAVEWTLGDQQGSSRSNPVRNPMFDIMLPYLSAQ